MGRGRSGRAASSKNTGIQLKPIQIDDRWAFHPRNADFEVSEDDLAENPIPFVGVGVDAELADVIDNGTIQTQYIDDTVIDISSLQTIQAFVLRSGVMNENVESDELPYVVSLDGQYYLIDGNHRAARAKLQGEKQIHVTLSVRQRTGS